MIKAGHLNERLKPSARERKEEEEGEAMTDDDTGELVSLSCVCEPIIWLNGWPTLFLLPARTFGSGFIFLRQQQQLTN